MSDLTFLVGGEPVAVSSASAAALAARLRELAATDASPGYAVATLIETCCGPGGVELGWTAREEAELLLAIEAWLLVGPLPADVTALRLALCSERQAA